MSEITIKGGTNQGWECPKCGRVYSPWVAQCYYCGENSTITSTDPSGSAATKPFNQTITIAAIQDQLLTLEEYKNQQGSMENVLPPEWSDPKFSCPECGGGMCRNEQVVLSSYPPMYEYGCNNCGHIEYLER